MAGPPSGDPGLPTRDCDQYTFYVHDTFLEFDRATLTMMDGNAVIPGANFDMFMLAERFKVMEHGNEWRPPNDLLETCTLK